jgi:hypothetical protein
MNKLIGWLRWVDNNLVKFSVIAFIFAIPLYPKFPLRTMDYTYISVRLDDIFVVLVVLIFFIQWLRKKVVLNKTFLVLFILFWAADLLSLLNGIYLQHTLIYRQVAVLNALRRLQYMSIFFIALSSVRTKEDFFTYIKYILVVIFLVSLYGLGQKFIGLPAVQTMNPEFALGHVLYLTPEARISSTFAGHYDLAAYLVFFIPLLLGIFLVKKRISYYIIFVAALFALMLTASRISFGAYIVSTLPFLIFLKKPKLLVSVILFTVLFTYLSKNLTSRFTDTFRIKQIFVNEKTGKVVIPQKSSVKELPAGSFYIEISQAPANNNEQANKLLVDKKILQDLRDEASRSGKVLTSSEEAAMLASISAGLKPVNTVISDISLATRLQVEWPRAIKALLKNPLLGTVPSSITESTDNDYLRWLGEFGLLGAGLFMFILFSIAKFVFENIKQLKEKDKLIGYGFLFGLGGLMFNASYIDVFEASKVAYTFWLISGILIAYLQINKTKLNEKRQ